MEFFTRINFLFSQYKRKEKKFNMVRFNKLCKKEDMKHLEQISWHGILSSKITIFEQGINPIWDTNHLGQYLIGYGRQPQPPS